MRPPVDVGVHRAPRCEPVVSLVRSRRAPPVPLIVLPKSCSCRWGPCPRPIPRLAWLFSFFLSGCAPLGFRCIVGKSRHRAHTESQREESGESQFQGSLWRATLSRRHGCQSGVSRPSLISPRRLPVVAVEPKRRRWRGRAGDRGKHDSHRPFTNRKAAPGEGTVIRALCWATRSVWGWVGSVRAPSTSLPLGA